MASIFDRLLTHTYTRVPVTAAAEDQWGINGPAPGNAAAAEVCFYNPSERARLGPDGALVIEGPTLLVAANSVLAVGDRVSNVAGGGSTLEAGPLTVDTLERLTLQRGIELKRAKLVRATATLA